MALPPSSATTLDNRHITHGMLGGQRCQHKVQTPQRPLLVPLTWQQKVNSVVRHEGPVLGFPFFPEMDQMRTAEDETSRTKTQGLGW